MLLSAWYCLWHVPLGIDSQHLATVLLGRRPWLVLIAFAQEQC